MVMVIKNRQVAAPALLREGLAMLGYFSALSGALMVSAQARIHLLIGEPLSPSYNPLPLEGFALFAASVVLVQLLGELHLPGLDRLLNKVHPFRRYLVMLGISFVTVGTLLPDVSRLQDVYFLVAGVMIGAAAIWLPVKLYLGHSGNDLLVDIVRLWRSRYLIAIWLRDNIQSRYAQQILGVAWVMLLPIATSVVLAIAFTNILQRRMDVPYIAFYISAIIHFNFFSNGVQSAAVAVISRQQLITQVYFPREVLIILALGEKLFDLIFTFTAAVFICAVVGIYPNPNYVWLPLLWLVLFILTAGVMTTVGAVTVLIRDTPQLVGVSLQMLFFLTPIIYPVERLPDEFIGFFTFNPIAPLVKGFRDIMVYNLTPDLSTLFYPLVFGVVCLMFGYCLFKSIEDRMADML